jgi:hypothetical protein
MCSFRCYEDLPTCGEGGGLIPTPEQRGIMVIRLSQTPALNLDHGLTIDCQTGRI